MPRPGQGGEDERDEETEGDGEHAQLQVLPQVAADQMEMGMHPAPADPRLPSRQHPDQPSQKSDCAGRVCRMIALEALTKRYGSGPPAVDALSLEVVTGAGCALIGPSGSGKSTTRRMINRLIR